MYNRYVGGKVYHIPETAAQESSSSPYASNGYGSAPPPAAAAERPKKHTPTLPFGMDSGDILFLLVLLLLYRESGDEDFLIILIAVGMSIFRDGSGSRSPLSSLFRIIG